jgi:L-arabinose transport system ATP-binding protein
VAPLEFRGISKAFPGVQALQDVSFAVPPGEAHALCGENGAGKSTLLKILSGVYGPDSGEIWLDGRRFAPANAREALAGGIAVIHQELNLVPDASVAENVFLGHMPSRGGWVDRRRLHEDTAAILARLGMRADPAQRLGDLPIGQRQLVEIAKALSREARVFAFDEPTSSLSAREAELLFAVIRSLCEAGCTVLYVSHRMAEIERVCAGATVLRDGRHVATYPSVAAAGVDRLVEDMVGRSIEEVFPYRPRELGEVAYRARGLASPSLASPVDLEVRAGEIVGVFGLAGSGRTELLRAVYGEGTGDVEVMGRRVSVRSPRQALRSGVALAPEDRKKEALFPGLSLAENLALPWRTGLFTEPAAEARSAEAMMGRLDIRASSVRQPVESLSGGNQQKVVLGRWLDPSIRLLLLDEPTRGVDVGAKREIHEAVADLAAQGLAILMVSSETAEVMGVSDRILVMREGSLAGELARAEASEEALLRLALPVAG